MNRHVVELPSLPSLLWRGGRQVVEGTVVPLGLFSLLFTAVGLRWAIVGAVAWSALVVVHRVVRRDGVPTILVIGMALLLARAAIAMASGTAFVYFLQPTLGTYLVAAVFLVSGLARWPLIQRLAADFCPLPASLVATTAMQRFFRRIALIWAMTYVVNGTATLYLLLTSSVNRFLLLKAVATPVLYAAAIGASYLLFRRVLRHQGVTLHWGPRRAPAAAA